LAIESFAEDMGDTFSIGRPEHPDNTLGIFDHAWLEIGIWIRGQSFFIPPFPVFTDFIVYIPVVVSLRGPHDP
jgi:hypothetical protein